MDNKLTLGAEGDISQPSSWIRSVPVVSGRADMRVGDMNRPKETGSATSGGDGETEGTAIDIGVGT